jgi:5-methylcytosine-specific restriction protein A
MIQFTVNAYERNQKARIICIEYYKKLNDGKIVCQICGFDFRTFYGEIAEGKIHIHHLNPLHEIGEEYEVDGVNDLIPICPNCHLVIHTKEPAL